MKAKLLYVSLFIVIGLSPTVAWSEGRAILQSDIVVSASRIPGRIEHISVSSTTITQDQIQSLEPFDAIDLLRRVPGLHIDKPGGLGAVSSIYMRGAEPNYTLVLIDGIPVNDPTNSRGGSFDISSIDLSNLDRIEILRGPQSAIYGADAISGVVNFITAEGNPSSGYQALSRIDSRGGDANNVWLQGPLGNKGVFSLGVTHLDEGKPFEGSSFNNSIGHVKANLQISDADHLTFTLRASETNGTAFPDDSGGPRYAKLRLVDSREATELLTGLRYVKQDSDIWNYVVESSLYRRRELSASPGVAPGLRSAAGVPVNNSETTFERGDLQITGSFNFLPGLKSIVGVNVKREFGTNNGRLILGGAPLDTRFVLRRSSGALFGENRWEVSDGWFINGSARFDFPDDYSVVRSLSLGVAYDFVPTDTLFKATWGEGFKLPSLYALGNELVGDPNLEPEFSKSIDFSLEQKLYDGASTFELSLFRNRYQNTIDFDASANRLVNRSIVSAWGAEAELRLDFHSRLSLGGQVSYVKTNIRGTTEKLKNRAKWRGGLDIFWAYSDSIDLSLSALRVGRIFSSSVPTGDLILPSSNVVSLTGKWALDANWRISTSIENIFGASVHEAVGFVTRNTTSRFSVRYSY